MIKKVFGIGCYEENGKRRITPPRPELVTHLIGDTARLADPHPVTIFDFRQNVGRCECQQKQQRKGDPPGATTSGAGPNDATRAANGSGPTDVV